MPALGRTNTQIYYAAGALAVVVLLIGGSKVVYDNTDTGLAKSAFALSKLCQDWKRTDQAKYMNCIRKLNLSLEKLKNRGILNVNECKPYPEDGNSAICPIKGSGRIIVTLPEIVAQAKKKGVTKRSLDKINGQYPPSQGDVTMDDLIKKQVELTNKLHKTGKDNHKVKSPPTLKGDDTIADLIKKKEEMERKLRVTGKDNHKVRSHPTLKGDDTMADLIKKKEEMERKLRVTGKDNHKVRSHPTLKGDDTMADLIKKKEELERKLLITGKYQSSGSS